MDFYYTLKQIEIGRAAKICIKIHSFTKYHNKLRNKKGREAKRRSKFVSRLIPKERAVLLHPKPGTQHISLSGCQ